MRSIEEQIRKAMAEGQFDNLSGKGKPLNLEENPHENPEWKMAHRMLKNGGYTLPWLEMRQEIQDLTKAQKDALTHAWNWRQSALQRGRPYELVELEWQRAVDSFRLQVDRINKRIRDHNLETPNSKFHLPHLNIEREIERTQQEGADQSKAETSR